jgi:hypothetical protein
MEGLPLFKKMENETIILERLKSQDIKAFKIVCLEFLKPLDDYAFTLLNDAAKSSELVSDVVGKIWATNGFLNATLPLLDFLKARVKEVCVKYLAEHPESGNIDSKQVE